MATEKDSLLSDVAGQQQYHEYEAVTIDRNPEKAPLPGTIPDVAFNMIPLKASYGIQPSHVLCATFIGSIGVVFGLVPIFLTDHGKNSNGADHLVPIIGRVCCSFVILLISGAYIIWKYVTMQRSGAEISITEILKNWRRNTKDFILFVIFKCPGLLQIFIFGIGSIVMSAVNIYKDEKPVLLGINMINLTLYISWPCAIVCQMVMYSWFVYENHKGIQRRPLLHEYAIAAMIGTHMWLWVSDATEPLWNTHDDDSDTTNNDDDDETGKGALLESLVPFLEPFYVEYLTISIGLLYELWDTCTLVKKQASATSINEPISWRSTWWIRHLVIAITLAVMHHIGSTVSFVSIQCDSNTTAYDHVVFTGVMGFFWGKVFVSVFLTICTIYAIFQLSTNRTVKSSSSSSGNISGYILILTTIAEFGFFMIRIVAAVIELHTVLKPVALSKNATDVQYDQNEQQSICLSSINNTPSNSMTCGEVLAMDVTLLLYPFFMILQVLLQTYLLLEAQRRLPRDIPKAVKKCLIYIIAMNFGIWSQSGAFLGFSKHCPSLLHPVMNDIFHKDMSRFITLVFFPLLILYRFHSAVIAWEIILDDEEEGVGVGIRRHSF